MSEKVTIIKVTMQVNIPSVPNYLKLSDEQVVPLYAITDDGLREIGKQWTEALIARSREMKRNADEPKP